MARYGTKDGEQSDGLRKADEYRDNKIRQETESAVVKKWEKSKEKSEWLFKVKLDDAKELQLEVSAFRVSSNRLLKHVFFLFFKRNQISDQTTDQKHTNSVQGKLRSILPTECIKDHF